MTDRHASVIVRARNEEAGIEAALRSLRAQTDPLEIVVVDSGSTDGTVDIARRWCDELVRIRPGSFTFGRALNLGAARASGSVLFALSAHCVAPHEHWVRDARAHYSSPATAATFGSVLGPTHAPLERARPVTWSDVASNPHWGYTNQGSSWRRSVWERQPFDETLASCEDKEWMWRVMLAGHEVVADPTAEVAAPHRRAAGLRSLSRRVYLEHRVVASLVDVPEGHSSLLATWWSSFPWPSPHPKWRRRLSPPRTAELLAGALGDRRGRRERSERTIVPPLQAIT